MKKKLLYMVAALLLAGCAADDLTDDQPDGDGLVPIRLSSGLEVQSRAHTGMDAQLPAGRSVAFWVDNAATSAQLYGNSVLTSNGSNGFTGGSTMYFPSGSDNVDIYAIHTGGTLTEAFPTAAVTHTVAADQTEATDYYNSDLLYAANKGVAKTASTVPMTFYHMLSKVRIAIMPGTPEIDLTGATVRIVSTKLSADFTPSKTADITSQTARAAMVAASGTATPITVSNETSADFTGANVKYNDAVVVPQKVAGGTAFISVTLANNTVLTWSPAAALTLESGKRYIYHVTVTRTGLDVTSMVVGWEEPVTEPEIQFEANSYMARPNGRAILIPVLRANKAANSFYNLGADATGLGGVTADNYTVELVWSDIPVGAGGVIKEMRPYEGGYIYVEPGNAGNAVICIKVANVIKWSWHIWVTEPVKWKTDIETGLTWMDRNLGSGGAGSYQSGGKNGLFYQWGRKDAFPGSDGGNTIQQYYTQAGGDVPTNVNPQGSYTELYQLAQNPLNFSTNDRTYYGSLNVSGDTNDSWGGVSGAKTIYDPCPPGWKVPPISITGTYSWGASTDWASFINNGRIFNGVNGTAGLNHFYPAAGVRSTDGFLYAPGIAGYYWSSSASNYYYGWTLYFDRISVYYYSNINRSNGFSVRCMAEY